MGTPVELYNLAKGYVGTEEQPLGSNRGLLIDRWNHRVGAPLGSFWCASFVSAMTRDFALANDITFPLSPSASCDDWLMQARRKNCLSSYPAPGALGLILSPSNSNDATHIFVLGPKTGDVYPSVEGNSNSGGSRNGYSVAERKNHLAGRNASRVVYIHWWELLDEEDGWQVKIGETLIDGYLASNSVYIPLRRTLTVLEGTDKGLTYDGKPMIHGKAVKAEMVVHEGKTYVNARSFLNEFGLPFEVKPQIKVIEVDHEKPSWI